MSFVRSAGLSRDVQMVSSTALLLVYAHEHSCSAVLACCSHRCTRLRTGTAYITPQLFQEEHRAQSHVPMKPWPERREETARHKVNEHSCCVDGAWPGFLHLLRIISAQLRSSGTEEKCLLLSRRQLRLLLKLHGAGS